MVGLGVIGTGHMGGSLVRGLVASGIVEPQSIIVSGGSGATSKNLATELGLIYQPNPNELAESVSTLILGTPSNVTCSVLSSVAPRLSSKALVISVAGGAGLADLRAAAGPDVAVVRAIPNIPVAVCAGMTTLSFEDNAPKAARDETLRLFGAVGKTLELPERLLGVATTVSGCSPAFAAMYAEALADAGVRYGLSREVAYQLAEVSTLGAMQMLLSSGSTPAQLKDMVTSPGGSTIRGVCALEDHGLRNAVIQAVNAIEG